MQHTDLLIQLSVIKDYFNFLQSELCKLNLHKHLNKWEMILFFKDSVVSLQRGYIILDHTVSSLPLNHGQIAAFKKFSLPFALIVSCYPNFFCSTSFLTPCRQRHICHIFSL